MRASTSKSSMAAAAGVRQRAHHHDKKAGGGGEFEQLPGSMLSSANVTPNSSGQSSPTLTRKGSSLDGRNANRRKRRKRANGESGGGGGGSSSSQDGAIGSLIQLATLPVAGIFLYNYLKSPSYVLSPSPSPGVVPLVRRLDSLTSKLVHLSYQIPQSGLTARTASYLKGKDDLYLVAFWVLVFTLMRECIIHYLWIPIGKRYGIKKTSNLLRFGEQGWNVVFNSTSWVVGFCIMQNSSYANLRTSGLWEDYPDFRLGYAMKMYYLVQLGFWTQQIITLNVEKPRKDYWQMFTHHIISLSLLILSYQYNFTRIGNVILMLMDPADVILGVAKMLKYIGLTTAPDAAFSLFLINWIICRQILYPKVIYAAIYESEKYIELGWNPQQERYLDRTTKRIFIALLMALQAILVLWFFMIIKVALSVLQGKAADDVRSEDEDSEQEEQENGQLKHQKPLRHLNGSANGRLR